jgi:macrodomain Ter protein organizer (MatP/YcbG family)
MADDSRREKRSERLEFRVTLSERKALEDVARKQRRTLSSLFAQFLEELVQKEKGPE